MWLEKSVSGRDGNCEAVGGCYGDGGWGVVAELLRGLGISVYGRK